jgi:hypothetical protein
MDLKEIDQHLMPLCLVCAHEIGSIMNKNMIMRPQVGGWEGIVQNGQVRPHAPIDLFPPAQLQLDPKITTAQRDPLGLTEDQRRVSDASELYGAMLGPAMAWSGIWYKPPAVCPYCRELGAHGGDPESCRWAPWDGEWTETEGDGDVQVQSAEGQVGQEGRA